MARRFAISHCSSPCILLLLVHCQKSCGNQILHVALSLAPLVLRYDHRIVDFSASQSQETMYEDVTLLKHRYR
jgi:hypothetical protein